MRNGKRKCIAFISLITAGACSESSMVAPDAGNLAARSDFFVFGESAPYTGELVKGEFKLCTSRIAPAGVYYYHLHRFNRKDGDSTPILLMTPGECALINSAKNKGGKSEDDSVRVVYDHTFVAEFPFTGDVFSTPDGLALIDESCSNDCEIPGFPTVVTLKGKSGAIAKYYFLRPGLRGNGGHGGGGTIGFELD